MSFQAYLDKVEEITGKTPNDFIAIAKEKNLTQHKDLIDWLNRDYGLGLGHARAMAYVIQHGPKFTLRQTTGPHRDASDTLILTGKQVAAAKAGGAKKGARKAATRKAAAKKTSAKRTTAGRSPVRR